MKSLRKTLGLATIAAMLMTSTAPALARPRHGWDGPYGGGWSGGYGDYGRHHRRHNGDAFGNFLLGAVVAGGIIAVASAASKNAREKREGTVGGSSSSGGDQRNWTQAENDAADMCADGVEALAAKQRGGQAKVEDIESVTRDGNDGYRVEGRLEGGKAFVCGTNRGEVTYVQFSDDKVAWR